MEQTEEIYDFSILLGKGGFGTVVKAIHRVKKVEVAIKIIPLTALTTLELQRRIENEIYIHKRVHHVNIIQLFEAFIERNQYYLVMECAKEKNLFHYLSLHGRLSEARAVKIIHQLLLALQYLHENRIVHRDVKLSNVLIADVVAQDLVIKLCDFGLAVELTHPDDDHYTYCGTPSYMAPETARQGQGLGHSEAGAAVDIWGMGIIFNALMSGSPPSNPTIPHSETVEISSTATSNARDFLRACLSENPKRRPTATVLLAHTLFQQPVTDVSQFTETNTSFTYTTKASSVSLPPPTRHTPVKSSFTPPQRAQRHSSTRLTASTTSLSSSTSSLYLPQHALERGGRGGQVTHSLWQKIKTKTKSLPSFLFFLDNHQTPPSSSSSSGDSSEAIFLTREGDLFLFQRRVKLFLQLGDGTDIVKVGRWGAEEVHRLQHYCNQEEEEEGLRRGRGGGGRNLVLFNHHNYPTNTTSISSLFDLTQYSKTLYCHDLFLTIDEPNTSFNTSFATSSHTSSHHSFKSIAAIIQSLLSRALKIIDRITLRIPKLIVYYTSSSSSMKCMFMSNQPLPDFHIQWTDGTRLTYSLQSNHLHILSTSSKLQWRGTLHLTPATGVGSDSSADTMPTQLRHYLHVSQQALLQCMKEERKLNDKSRLSLTSASMSDKRLTGPLVTFIKN